MYPDLHPCAHPGCTRHALHGRATCGPHAAAEDQALAPAAWPTLDVEQYIDAAAYDLAIAQRDCLHRYLRLRAGYPLPDLTAELRTLRALALTARDLGPAGGEDAASARAEIDAFLDMLCEDVLDHPGAPTDPASLDSRLKVPPGGFPQLEAGERRRGLS